MSGAIMNKVLDLFGVDTAEEEYEEDGYEDEGIEEEQEENSRAKSAKLRILERIG